MQDIALYRLVVRGTVGEDEINRGSPLEVRAAGTTGAGRAFTVRADQAGLIGLLRHLHGQGFVMVSVIREEKEEGDADIVTGCAGKG